MKNTSGNSDAPDHKSRNARIVELRNHGISWKEIQGTFGLTRQQARYAYQLGKRAERRAARRGGS
jgi:hypothetical protein